MNIIPAIDVRDGKCVRLRQGDFNAETVYGDDPVVMAKKWIDAGSRQLHVVDLDGALTGIPANFDIISKIAQLNVLVQVGGGIRTSEIASRYRDAGVNRIILGTAAAVDRVFLEEACDKHGSALIVALDARGFQLSIQGWTKSSNIDIFEFAIELVEMGVGRFIYTDISRDGMLTSPNYDQLKRLIDTISVPVIASGGVANLNQIPTLVETGAESLIIGRALYDGRIDLSSAIRLAKDAS